MRDVPNVLIIEKSRFAANVPVEECERVGKTADNKSAIIRYQRRADVGVVKQIGRFFSDLFNGVTRAKGIVCDKPELPAILHIRGERFNITKDASSSKAVVASPHDGPARQPAALPALKIEVHEVPLRKSHPALAYKVAEELRDRFEAVGQKTDRLAVEYFLELDAEPNFDMTPVRVARLMQFSDALGRMSGALQRELGADVLAHVLDRMQHWQDRIAKVEAQGPGGPAPAYPGFRFSGLSAFGASTADAIPNRAAPTNRTEVPQAMPAPAARPAPVPVMQPLPAEALQQPQPQPQVQPQPRARPQPEVRPQPREQPLPELPPQFHAQPEPEVQPLPPVQPLPDLQPRPQVQPPLQAQRQPEAQVQPEPEAQPGPQATSETQPPEPEPEPALAPPPPPPPPPPAIKPSANTAASSAGPDANELASAASRLKPAATNAPKTKAPEAKDDSLLGILTSAMAGRRTNLNEEANNKQDDNDDDWK